MTFIVVGGAAYSRRLPRDKHAAAQVMRDAPSPGEDLLWRGIRGGQLRAWREPVRVNRQQVIRGFIADFYFPAFRAICEVDGEQHDDDAAAAYDERRDRLFLGWRYSILRVSHRLVVTDTALVGDIIASFLEDVGHQGRYRTTSKYWSFGGRGVLHEPGVSPRHWFRIAENSPESLRLTFGADIGETDCHPIDECQESGCLA